MDLFYPLTPHLLPLLHYYCSTFTNAGFPPPQFRPYTRGTVSVQGERCGADAYSVSARGIGLTSLNIVDDIGRLHFCSKKMRLERQ
jgi:hypothetical protein